MNERICGEMVVYEGGESAGICQKPYGHTPKHHSMPHDEYRARSASLTDGQARSEEEK